MTTIFSLLGFTPALCHSNPCKEKWIAEFANETSKVPVKIVGATAFKMTSVLPVC